MNIIRKSIHIIDYDNQETRLINAPESFDSYVSELINHINSNISVREYKTRSNATEVIGCILNMCSNDKKEDIFLNKTDIIAKRLLFNESDAQSKINRTNTTVQRGSLVQALLFEEDENKYVYLLAKVEHTEWVDDSDFTFKTGFSKDKKKMWKSCLFDIQDALSDVFYAKVYSDTKAQYWSNGFLELDEVYSDESNTVKAFSSIDATLGRSFRGIISPDHTLIRNSFVHYMKSNEHIDYPKMVESILGNYTPVDSNISLDKISEIKERLLEQPQKKNFDNQFNAVGSAINARIKRVYQVNEGIELKVNGDIKELSETINSYEENGVRYIRIRTNNMSTYKQFFFKNKN